MPYKPRVLVGCEASGIVRDAFTAMGCDAWSCDLYPTDSDGNHIQADLLSVLDQGWDLLIAHPPCTHLASSGARWFKDKQNQQQEALAFVKQIFKAPIRRICIENPVGVITTKLGRKPTQIIHPWQYGHEAEKTTCLWLKNLPQLQPTHVVSKGKMQKLKSGKVLPEWYSNAKVFSWLPHIDPKEERRRERSKTFPGIAQAMASQWSPTLPWGKS